MEIHIASRLTGHIYTATGEFHGDLFEANDGKIFGFSDVDDTVFLIGSRATYIATKKWVLRGKDDNPYLFIEPPRLGTLV